MKMPQPFAITLLTKALTICLLPSPVGMASVWSSIAEY